MTTRNIAAVWKFFEKVDTENKLAMCNYCKKCFSYKTTSTNLKQHLKLIHKKVYRSMMALTKGSYISEEENTSEDESDEDSQTPMWNYFERETGGRARCAVCCASVTSAGNDLREHLRKKHPRLFGEITKDSNHQEENSNDDVYTEVVYLEETPSKDEKVMFPPKKQKKYACFSKRSNNLSPVENAVKKKRIENANVNSDDEIESFSSYLICLLKKFPKDVSMKLQRDIINLVMNAKLNSVENEIKDNTADDEAGYYVIRNKIKSTSEQNSDTVSASQNHSYNITISTSSNDNDVDREET